MFRSIFAQRKFTALKLQYLKNYDKSHSSKISSDIRARISDKNNIPCSKFSTENSCDQIGLIQKKRQFTVNCIIFCLMFMVLAGTAYRISFGRTSESDLNNETKSSGHSVLIPKTVSVLFVIPRNFKLSKNDTVSLMNNSVRNANTHVHWSGFFAQIFSVGSLQNNSVPLHEKQVTPLTKNNGLQNYQKQIGDLENRIHLLRQEEPMSAAESSGQVYKNSNHEEAEPTINEIPRINDFSQPQLMNLRDVLRSISQDIVEDFEKKSTNKFRSFNESPDPENNRARILHGKQKLLSRNINDSSLEDLEQPYINSNDYAADYNLSSTNYTNALHKLQNILEEFEIESFIPSGTRQKALKDLNTLLHNVTKIRSKSPRKWHTIIRKLSGNASLASGLNNLNLLTSQNFQSLVIPWLNMLRWAAGNELQTNLFSMKPMKRRKSREACEMSRLQILFHEISTIGNKTIGVPLLISSIVLPFTHNMLFVLKCGSNEFKNLKVIPQYAIEVCFDSNCHVNPSKKRTKRSLHRQMRRDKVLKSPFYKTMQQQDIPKNFGLNRLSPPERKANFLTVIPETFNCYGSTSLCFFCYLFLFYSETDLDPGVCQGACAVAVGGSCGLLFGRGIQRMGQQTVICTELYRQGLMSREAYEADAKFGLRLEMDHPEAMVMYRQLAKPVVTLMQKSRLFTALVEVLSRSCRKHMEYVEGLDDSGPVAGRIFVFVSLRVLTALWYVTKAKNQLYLASLIALVTVVGFKCMKRNLGISLA